MFGKKVKEKLDKNTTGEIQYGQYTFAELNKTVNQVGLEICNNLKLEKKIKTEQYFNRKETGDFCDQFDLFKSEKRKTFRNKTKNKKEYITKRNKQSYKRNYKRPQNEKYKKTFKKQNKLESS